MNLNSVSRFSLKVYKIYRYTGFNHIVGHESQHSVSRFSLKVYKIYRYTGFNHIVGHESQQCFQILSEGIQGLQVWITIEANFIQDCLIFGFNFFLFHSIHFYM